MILDELFADHLPPPPLCLPPQGAKKTKQFAYLEGFPSLIQKTHKDR